MVDMISYFNPLSNQHHALQDFQSLDTGKKILVGFATLGATLISLPILGLGGVATFRALVNEWKAKDLTRDEYRADANPRLTQTLEKTDDYVQVMQKFLKKENLSLTPFSNLPSQEDLFFDTMANSSDSNPTTIFRQMKDYVEANPERVREIWEATPIQGNFPLESFKELITAPNLMAKLRETIPADQMPLTVDLQRIVTLGRCQILSDILNKEVITHDVAIRDNVGFRGGNQDDIREGVDINETTRRFIPKNGIPVGSIELVFGNALEIDTLGMKHEGQFYMNNTFISPRAVNHL